MKNEYLLSIVIPTKNRQYYAKKCVENILLINDKRLQVVIQDNSDSMLLQEMLCEYKEDTRLKYSHVDGVVSFVDNFNMAIEQADGEYVCVIGDDDGINPYIMDIIDWANCNNIEAIKPELKVDYIWPDSNILKNDNTGNVIIKPITTRSSVFSPGKAVIELLHNGCQNYLEFNMVKLYHGVVKKSCLNEVKKYTGNYFGGLTPDIYAAVALSLIVKNAIQIDYPLTIAGACQASGHADAATGRHTGRLEDAPHFRGHDKYEWNEHVPQIYSVETIWAVTALDAIADLNKTLLKEYNILALFKDCSKKYPQFSKDILVQYSTLKDSGKLPQNSFKIISNYYNYLIIKFIKRVKSKINRIEKSLVDSENSKTFFVNGVENVNEASFILQERLNDIGVSVCDVISSLNKTAKIKIRN